MRVGGRSKAVRKYTKRRDQAKKAIIAAVKRKIPPTIAELGAGFLQSDEGKASLGRVLTWGRRKRSLPKFSFKMPNLMQQGESLDASLIHRMAAKDGDIKDISLHHGMYVGRKSKFFDNIKKISKSKKFILQEDFLKNLAKPGQWHGYSTTGYERQGTWNPYALMKDLRLYRQYEAIGTNIDFMSLWFNANGIPAWKPSDIPEYPDGAQEVFWGVEKLSNHHTFKNGNQFEELFMTIYLCTPRNNTNSHPIEDWYNIYDSGVKDSSKIPGAETSRERMNNMYSFPCVIDNPGTTSDPHPRVMESSVVKGATPYYSEKFKDSWNVGHVYKIKLLAGQSLNLKIDVKFGGCTSLKEVFYSKYTYLKGVTVVPLITFYGPKVTSLDLDKSDGSPLEKTSIGTSPVLLLHENFKTGSIHCPTDRIIGPDGKLDPSAGTEFGFTVRSRELMTIEDYNSCNYVNVNDNRSVSKDPVVMQPGSRDMFSGTDPGGQLISIKTVTDERIVATGSMTERERPNKPILSGQMKSDIVKSLQDENIKVNISLEND